MRFDRMQSECRQTIAVADLVKWQYAAPLHPSLQFSRTLSYFGRRRLRRIRRRRLLFSSTRHCNANAEKYGNSIEI